MPLTLEQQQLTNSPPFRRAFQRFLQAYPAYEQTTGIDRLRASDYSRLDGTGQIYLDYTGGGLYADSQVESHLDLLRQHVFGNPHSINPTSMAMTRLVDQARAYVLEFFNASTDEYVAIFTPNASGALKLVGEAYPFQAGSRYLLTVDNHNSVNGIREFARRRGAAIHYLPVHYPQLRLDAEEVASALSEADPDRPNLFAFPAQSNFSGVQHPLELIEQAQQQGWDVLVDAAAFAPSNRLDLSRYHPDFVPLSFYKIFGYPTGVGALLARREALARLRRPWFAGGTIRTATVQGDAHFLMDGDAGFEDGTVNYLNLPAVESGLRHVTAIGIEIIHRRVECLAGWLLDSLQNLKHDNGAPLLDLYGPPGTANRGGTLTFNLLDPSGHALDIGRIEEMATARQISLRTGCFCNPGAGEVAARLTPEQIKPFFGEASALSFHELRQAISRQFGKEIGAIRVSIGLASNFHDVYQFSQFAALLRNCTASQIGQAEARCGAGRDSA